MFKNIISPVQAWLLSQGRCVGCGKPLRNGQQAGTNTKNKEEKIICKKCGRIYIYDLEKKHYRRAPLPGTK